MDDNWLDPALTGATFTVQLDVIRAGIARLAKLDPIEYDLGRKGEAKKLGLSVATLDAEVAKLRPAPAQADAPAESVVEELEPWPAPVDGAEIADRIAETLRKHVVFGAAEDADAAVLWLFGSYLMDRWRLFPKLLIQSPTKRCGKTTLLETLEAFAYRASVCASTSPAALYRLIEEHKPTLIVDEADRFLAANPELNGIVNAGHVRRTAYVNRCEETPTGQVVKRFSVWGAMVFASIGNQADTLMDRSVRIELRRRLPGETVARLPFDLYDRMRMVRRQALRWSLDHAERIGESEAEPPEAGNDRRRDNFAPLWRIAEALGGAWPDRALAAYRAAGRPEDDDAEPPGVLLVADVHGIFEKRGAEYLSTADVLSELLLLADRPWPDWSHGRPITANRLGRLAKAFGMGPRQVKRGREKVRLWSRAEARDAFSRYVSAAEPEFPGTNMKNKEKNPVPDTVPTRANPVPDANTERAAVPGTEAKSVPGFSDEKQRGTGISGFSGEAREGKGKKPSDPAEDLEDFK